VWVLSQETGTDPCRKRVDRVRPLGVDAAVILDVAFDHCLARTWERHCEEPLAAFAARTYAAIERHRAAIPWREPGRIERMLRGRWLHHYRDAGELERVFAALGRRARHGEAIAGAGADVAAHLELLSRRLEELLAELRGLARDPLRVAAVLEESPPLA